MAIARGAWTDELVQDLKKWFENGSTMSQISRQIAETHRVFFSRDAIVGKIHRLGLTRDRKPGRIASRAAPQRRPNGDRTPSETTFTARTVDTSPRHIAFANLQSGECKYECSGQGDVALFTFCGQPTRDGETLYCLAHAGLCYVAPATRHPVKVANRLWRLRGQLQ